VKVRFVGGPLAGRELVTGDEPWAGSWLTTGDRDWALYRPVHQDPATGTVLAEVQATAPRRR
jgi:hypothetical protein